MYYFGAEFKSMNAKHSFYSFVKNDQNKDDFHIFWKDSYMFKQFDKLIDGKLFQVSVSDDEKIKQITGGFKCKNLIFGREISVDTLILNYTNKKNYQEKYLPKDKQNEENIIKHLMTKRANLRGYSIELIKKNPQIIEFQINEKFSFISFLKDFPEELMTTDSFKLAVTKYRQHGLMDVIDNLPKRIFTDDTLEHCRKYFEITNQILIHFKPDKVEISKEKLIEYINVKKNNVDEKFINKYYSKFYDEDILDLFIEHQICVKPELFQMTEDFLIKLFSLKNIYISYQVKVDSMIDILNDKLIDILIINLNNNNKNYRISKSLIEHKKTPFSFKKKLLISIDKLYPMEFNLFEKEFQTKEMLLEIIENKCQMPYSVPVELFDREVFDKILESNFYNHLPEDVTIIIKKFVTEETIPQINKMFKNGAYLFYPSNMITQELYKTIIKNKHGKYFTDIPQEIFDNNKTEIEEQLIKGNVYLSFLPKTEQTTIQMNKFVESIKLLKDTYHIKKDLIISFLSVPELITPELVDIVFNKCLEYKHFTCLSLFEDYLNEEHIKLFIKLRKKRVIKKDIPKRLLTKEIIKLIKETV